MVRFHWLGTTVSSETATRPQGLWRKEIGDKMLKLGDTVTNNGGDPRWDGTVVDIIEKDGRTPSYLRVYWRYPLGRVADHHAGELVKVA